MTEEAEKRLLGAFLRSEIDQTKGNMNPKKEYLSVEQTIALLLATGEIVERDGRFYPGVKLSDEERVRAVQRLTQQSAN